jgi:uncharacterized membrane protein YqjE
MAETTNTRADARSVPQLLADLSHELGELIRGEGRLARAEVSEKVSQVQSGAVSLAVGGVVAFAGFLYLLLSAVMGLSNWVDPWLAALIVGGVVLLIGAIMLARGRSSMRADNLMPERTMRSAQRDADMVRTEVQR